jgi:hypothetical protein
MADRQIACSYCAHKRCFVGDLSQAPECSRMLDNVINAQGLEENLRFWMWQRLSPGPAMIYALCLSISLVRCI